MNKRARNWRDLIFNNNLIMRLAGNRGLQCSKCTVIRKSLLILLLGDLNLALPKFLNCFFVDGERAVLNLVDVLSVGNFFIRTVLVLFFVAEDGLDLVVELVTTVSDEENLECLLNGDASLERLIVHQELNEVEQLAGFESGFEAVLSSELLAHDAALVHGQEFVVVDMTVQIIIDLPNDQTHLSPGWAQAQELEDTGDIHGANFILVLWELLCVYSQEMVV